MKAIVSGSCWRRKSDGRLALVERWADSDWWIVDTHEQRFLAHERSRGTAELLDEFD